MHVCSAHAPLTIRFGPRGFDAVVRRLRQRWNDFFDWRGRHEQRRRWAFDVGYPDDLERHDESRDEHWRELEHEHRHHERHGGLRDLRDRS